MNDQQRAGRIALEEARDRSTRIRVGLTGLVGILLIVGLASAMMSRLTANANQGPPVAATQAAAQAKADAEPVEPLAELGVAPGAPEAAVVQPAPGQPTQ